MTQDDITKLAKKAGLYTHKDVQPEILAFANLVAAAQKEADAKLCEEIEPFYGVMFANAIRARSQT